jgi:nucleoside-diphosphate-sugar epimerase
METLYNNILIFGGTGSLGTTLVKLWLPKSKSISVYSRDEFKHWKIKQDYKVKTIIGDVNDYTKVLDTIIKINPTLIVLASAMKHIDQCEVNPKDCIDTNVYGLIQIMNALDTALRTALLQKFPELSSLELVDYKVRILDGGQGTGAVTRVLIETSDKSRRWDTVGVHENVIVASWLALEDALSYGLLDHN